ncbi:MAG TPA: cation transporter [Candidatus Lustribacter sp.]|nr:cation transporter [Candidatus Lustribacter sp.]
MTARTHTHTPLTVLTPPRHRTLAQRAQLLAAASVTYNVAEAVIALSAGTVAGSTALIGFGLDSTVEVASGLVILWQFRHPMPETRERRAQRLIAVSFFALAAYVVVESVRALLGAERPDSSPVGIGLALASLAVMPLLSWAQRRTGRELGSGAVVADGTQTLLCTYLSAVLLLGLLANALLGWWWLDASAALVIAAVAVREGLQSWRGEGCCAPEAVVGAGPDSGDPDSGDPGGRDDCCAGRGAGHEPGGGCCRAGR